MPRMPLSAKSFSMSLGYSAFSSISAARGATLSWTSSRIVSLIASCSSENSKSISGHTIADQIAGDDHPLDLVGALVDLQRLGIAYVALERGALDRPFVAGQLQCVEGELHRGVRAVQLGHRSLAGERTAGAAQPGRVVGHEPGRLQPRGHVGEQEVVALLARAPREELPRLVECRLRNAERLA